MDLLGGSGVVLGAVGATAAIIHAACHAAIKVEVGGVDVAALVDPIQVVVRDAVGLPAVLLNACPFAFDVGLGLAGFGLGQVVG